MKALRIAAVTMALGTSIAVVPGLASAHKKHPGNQNAAPTSKLAHTTKYMFRGVVVSTPAVGATSVSVEIRSGNKAGVTLAGSAPIVQNFALGTASQLMSWNAAGTAAAPVASSSLLAGDPVSITVWGPSKTTLATLLSTTPVTRIDDVLNSSKPAGRLFIFFGRVQAADPVTGALTINVSGGNWRALHALTGQIITQTFHYSTATTTFLNYNGKGKAHLVSPVFTANQPVSIRIFSANYDSQISTLLSLPAWRINLHEPAHMLRDDIKKHNDHRM